MCCKIKSSAVKCIHYSWSVICNKPTPKDGILLFLLLFCERHHHNSTKCTLNDTVTFLEKESQATGSLVSLEGVGFLFSCSWTSHSGPLAQVALSRLLWDKQAMFGHLGTASLPEGCGHSGALPISLLCEGPPPTAGGCSTCPHSLLFPLPRL